MTSGPLPNMAISTNGLVRDEVLVLLMLTIRELKWDLSHLHPMKVVATVPPKGLSGLANFTIRTSQDGLTLESRSQGLFGRKKRDLDNVEKFAEAFAIARVSTPADVMARELKELRESGVMDLDAASADADKFRWKDLTTLLIPRKGFFITPLLILLNIAIYLIMVVAGVDPFSPSAEEIYDWGGNYRPATMAGEWWRLLTACFLHFGIMHLLMNVYALTMVAVHLEPILGRSRMLALYIVTGLFSSASSLWWYDNTVSAGASGAVFGMYGVFLALLMSDLLHKEVRKPLLQSIGIFVVYNLVYGLKGEVDNAAHLGGLISGLFLGFFTYLGIKRAGVPGVKWVLMLVPVLVLGMASAVAIIPLVNDDALYETRLQPFFDNQEQGMMFFHKLQAEVTNDELLDEVRGRSLPAWYANRALLYELERMDLSQQARLRHQELLRYCDLRIKYFDLMQIRLHEFHPLGIDDQIAEVAGQIDAVLAGMNGGAGDEE